MAITMAAAAPMAFAAAWTRTAAARMRSAESAMHIRPTAARTSFPHDRRRNSNGLLLLRSRP